MPRIDQCTTATQNRDDRDSTETADSTMKTSDLPVAILGREQPGQDERTLRPERRDVDSARIPTSPCS